MGQIANEKSVIKRANIRQLSDTSANGLANYVPAAGEYILISSDNSMTSTGQGNFDCFIKGDGTTAASSLELKQIDDDVPIENSANGIKSGAIFKYVMPVIDVQSQNTIYNTTGNTATDYVIGSNGVPSPSSSYKMVTLVFNEKMTIWFESTDKLPFTSMYAISTMKNGVYTSRKRYIANSTDTLPTQASPLILEAGTTLYLNGTKAQYTNHSYFTFHYLKESVGLNQEKVLAAANIRKNKCVYNGTSSGNAAEMLYIYIAQESDGYILYNFVRSYDTSINCNVWRVNSATYCDNNLSPITALTTAGEWEAAIKISGRSDFMGGIAHGDEVFTDIEFIIDGKVTNVSSITTAMDFDEIRIYQSSNLYDPNDSTTIVAKHTSEHIFNSDGVKINQSVNWLASLTLAESYMAMFPVAQAVTDTYCTEKDFTPTAIPSGGFSNKVVTNVKKVCLWSAHFFSEFGIEQFTDYVNPPRLLMHNNAGTSYNKCYFYSTLSNGGTQVANGDIWKTTTYFKLKYKL